MVDATKKNVYAFCLLFERDFYFGRFKAHDIHN